MLGERSNGQKRSQWTAVARIKRHARAGAVLQLCLIFSSFASALQAASWIMDTDKRKRPHAARSRALRFSTPCARRLFEACLPRMAARMHDSYVLARILEYANSPKETAQRHWCLSKAWLRAHDAPALWRTLKITALPTDNQQSTASSRPGCGRRSD